ncbi:MAG: 4Fe-4S dicluster domain-containing protein [Dechloromonas sp.]|uniref:4Fe-4S dicluster domain-containing protein n=1 Tax=Candidatus Dechloromonas phosphorivorans TaxID=2899244 RepID=A0A935K2N1_9RHOO|nr:4Fe-4S dicluster domain-containing protein [Candidatus Dechloromonas phosphorivorans]
MKIVGEEGKTGLQINGQNCIRCKTYDIKVRRRTSTGRFPEGGERANLTPNM